MPMVDPLERPKKKGLNTPRVRERFDSNQMEQFELAIQFLRRRAVSTQKVNKKLMRQFIAVLPISEVDAVLEMVKSGEFQDFYNKQKRQRHPDFL